jgi:nucleoside-triphosphatase THEP1/ABC-type thiamin/hydroxymethylpyrimidine transport system permease subunit
MNKQIYYRLIALWVLCEAMLGGIIHGLKIPVSGLFVGSCAVVCICLIAWYVPQKGAILKATIIVAIFKMMLSPQAPPPAYIAVFFQGLMGELLFLQNRKMFKLSCILLAVLALLDSGLQRILVLTIVYGNDLWKVINDFINGLTKQKIATNYSLLIGSSYVVLHLATGLFVGWWTSLLPGRIERWKKEGKYKMEISDVQATTLPAVIKKRKRLRTGLFITWIILIALYVQSYFNIGKPLLPSHIALKIFIRSLIIVLGWIFVIGPLLKQLLHRWLQKEKTRSQQEIKEVLELLPATQQLIVQSWKNSAHLKGVRRLSFCSKIIFVNTFSLLSLRREAGAEVYILSAPIQSGKTTSLINWSANRNDVYGILTPVVNGKRVFMNVNTKERFPMEAKEGEREILTVGRFAFSKNNFERAIQIIRDDISKNGWLIIDEIGPLELAGQGFHDVLLETLRSFNGKLLLVVRDKDETVERVKSLLGNRKVIIFRDLNHPEFV